MPIYIQYTLACDRTGCGALTEAHSEIGVPSQPITGPALPVGWAEYNGELRCPDCQDCTDGDL